MLLASQVRRNLEAINQNEAGHRVLCTDLQGHRAMHRGTAVQGHEHVQKKETATVPWNFYNLADNVLDSDQQAEDTDHTTLNVGNQESWDWMVGVCRGYVRKGQESSIRVK